MWERNTDLIYRVQFSKLGLKQLKKLAKSDVIRVLKKIKVLENFPVKSNNIKRLQGTKKFIYRMRVGNIRVIFEVEKNKKLVWVIAVGYRGGVYAKF